jgi:MFS transporter, DHA1 family, staphyloferrin A biosynthesis exporter
MFHSIKAYPGVRQLWLGTLATNTAFWMYQIALGWLALTLTDSPFFVGLSGFFAGIPIFIFALPSGVIIDRFSRRSVLMSAQVAIMIVASIFAIMIYTDTINRFWILVLAFAYGTSMAFVFPTRQAIIPSLVSKADLGNAVALNAAGQNATRVFGPSLAGILIFAIGLSGTFAVAAALQIIALLSTARLPRIAPIVRSGGRPRLFASLTEGLVYVARDPVLTGLILIATIATVFIMPYLNLMPVFARDELNLGSGGLGLLMACAGIGSVAGALSVAAFKRLLTTPGFQVISCGGFALVVLIFSQTPWVWPAAAILVVSGLVSAAFLAINNTVLVMRAPEEVRGRVLSINMLTWGLLPVGQLPIGWLADHIGAPNATSLACVIAILLVFLIAWKIPHLRPGAPRES